MWVVHGEMLFFALPDHGPNSVLWNIQKFRNPPITNAISMLCNNTVVKILTKFLTKFFAFIMRWFCDTLVMRHLFTGQHFGLNQLNKFSLTRAESLSDYRLISDGVFAFHAFLHLPFLNVWTSMVWFLCMCGLHGLLPTSGECFLSIAPLEIYLLRKMLKCFFSSFLILILFHCL